MNNNQDDKKVWFVTGASKGLGLTLAKKLLSEGFRVAATSRNAKALIEAVGEKSENFLPLEMDLLNEQSVSEAIQKTLAAFGEIDVIVNNAGYGQVGTLEEVSDQEVRNNFDVNVFSVLNVIRSVMPHLRAQRSGHVFNISSIGGYTANFAGWGIYCSTKFAVAALTESLAAEVKSFNVTATVVYPGYFRTDFLTKDSMGLPENPIAEYEEARQSVDFHQNEMNGNQPGDPEKLADVLIKIASEANPPLHLFLGSDAYNSANAKIAAVQGDLENWKSLTISTDFENAKTA
ncbi:MAG: oxidoreductase [Acidobacteriota bacterium]|nr:oxidoreductase [Acidobacteriota bacterium]